MMAGILLVAVFGGVTRGSRRAIQLPFFEVQASELGKVLLIVALAAFVVDRARGLGERDTTARLVLVAMIPAILVMSSDLGSGLVYIVILFAVLFVAGVSWRHFAGLVALGAVSVALRARRGAGASGVTVLKPYQTERLTSFLHPTDDPSEAGYQQNQSRIAIGAGGKTGRGDRATQGPLNFLPEQHTDFLFAVVGERWGFAGAALVLSLYALLIWRGLRILTVAKNLYGALIAGGIVAMLLFQVFVNVGMNVGIMPITGIPLPLLSYGGSSVITTLLAIGLLQSIYAQGRVVGCREGPGPLVLDKGIVFHEEASAGQRRPRGDPRRAARGDGYTRRRQEGAAARRASKDPAAGYRVAELYFERRGARSIVGNIYKGKVDNVLAGLEAAFVDIGLDKNGFLHVDEIVMPGVDVGRRGRGKEGGSKITELLKPGQEIVVQVVKDPLKSKGARLSMELTIAGRYMVYAPTGEGVGVSRRLDDKERERLRREAKGLDLRGGGAIIRTAAHGATRAGLRARAAVPLQAARGARQARRRDGRRPASSSRRPTSRCASCATSSPSTSSARSSTIPSSTSASSRSSRAPRPSSSTASSSTRRRRRCSRPTASRRSSTGS